VWLAVVNTVLKFRVLLNAGNFFATRAANRLHIPFSGMLVLTALLILFTVMRNFITKVFCKGSSGNLLTYLLHGAESFLRS